MMIFSLVAVTGLEKCCITSAYLQWLCQSSERPVAHGPLVYLKIMFFEIKFSTYLNRHVFVVSCERCCKG